MNLIEFFKIALGSLSTNKLRTALSLLGIIIGVASVITLVSIGTGAQEQVTSQIGAMGSNLITVSPGFIRGGGGRVSQDIANVFTLEMAKAIQNLSPNIQHVVPTSTTSGLAVYGGNNVRVQISGVTPEYQEVINHYPVIGRYIRDQDVANNEKIAVLGWEVAEDLFGSENPVGKAMRVVIGGRSLSLTVVGVMEAKGQVMMANYDNRIYVPVTMLLNRGLNSRYVDGYSIMAASRDAAKSVVEEVEAFMTRMLGDSDRFRVMSQDTILEAVSQATGTMTLMLGAIASISLLVGGIGIMNIMLVTVSERTREIGIRKAVGAKRQHILAQFLLESVLLSVFGGLLGLAVGWGGGYWISKVLGWPFSVSIPAVMVAIGFSAGVGLFFGIYPALQAASLDPVVALRYE
ncbi:MAG: FtsX-like permease family protein [Firmicutes bacterium]|jgi:putative ABC transport system permease protein|nr:FtsX-like permease family protein [Bacillota bacterium]